MLIQRHLSEPSDRRKRGKDLSSRPNGNDVRTHLGFKPDRSQRLSQISATDSNVEEYWFVCRKWFDRSKGDKQTIRELLPTDPNGNPLGDRQG